MGLFDRNPEGGALVSPLSPGTGGGAVVSNVFKTEYRTVTGGEITAKQMTLAFTPTAPSEVMVDMIGVGPQWFPTDFTVTGNVLSWNGLGLESLLQSGDFLRVAYVY